MKKLYFLILLLACSSLQCRADFVVDNLKYHVLTDSTVSVTGGSVNGSLVIPQTVYDEDEDVTYTVTEIGEEAFSLWNGPRISGSVTLPSTITQIDSKAFYYQSFSSINFPDGLKKIGDYCFDVNRNLQQITLPASLETLGEGAFQRCGLNQVFMMGNKPAAIGQYAFADNQYLNIIVKPSCYDVYRAAWTEYTDYVTDIFPLFISGEVPPYDLWGADGLRVPVANYRTFCSPVACDLTHANVITTWTVDSIADNKAYASKIDNNVIPANTGVILMSDEDTVFVQLAENQDAKLDKTNLLCGVLKNTHINPTDSNGTNYVLNDTVFTKFDDSDQWRSYVEAGHAYLKVAASTATDTLNIHFEGWVPTAIRQIKVNENTVDKNKPNDGRSWLLNGMPAPENYKGIVIRNHKKFVQQH